MLKFISFGSGSSGNCYLLYTATDGLMIDAGISVRTLKKRCKEYGIDISRAHHILITHDHADHIKSVGNLSTDYNLPVYTTSMVHQGIKRNYCCSRKIPFDKQIEIEKCKSFDVGEFHVTPFGVPHDSADNVGYIVEHDGIAFGIITDAGSVTDDMKRAISKVDYLVIEANHDEEMVRNGNYPAHLKERILSDTGHLSNANCARTLAENMSERLKSVWLCHLSEENNHPELARKTIESTLRSYGIVVGADLQLEVLKRTTPTGPFDLE